MFALTQRAYSSKTRIKTIVYVSNAVATTLKEHIPVKQGLRLHFFKRVRNFCITQRAYSSKTRIKTILTPSQLRSSNTLKEHIPVKQGLRLSNATAIINLRI